MTIRLLILLVVFNLGQSVNSLTAVIHLEPDRDSYQLNARVDLLEDTGGKLSLADIRSGPAAAAFKQSSGGLSSFCFTDSAYWFRFDIENPSPNTRSMLLVLRTTWLDTKSTIRPMRPEALTKGNLATRCCSAHANISKRNISLTFKKLPEGKLIIYG